MNMDVNKLRTPQAPLKERFRQHPESAVIPTRAEGTIEGEEIGCSIATHNGRTVDGLHLAAGGDGSKACSADMLMQPRVAWADVTLRTVASAMPIPLKPTWVITECRWGALDMLS
jgi:hypothetical protein